MSSYKTRQHLFVHGFIRELRKKYAINIPIDLVQVCFVLVYEKGMVFEGENSGYYEWNILDLQLINKILNAETGEYFETDIFKLCGLQWRIQIYSNGRQDKPEERGSVRIHLQLIKMSSLLNKICISLTILCKPSNCACTGFQIMKHLDNP